ncbi:hypothetical protein IMG5_101490 [Ichthyophthirius multifiliis]|uniref:Transmembrane protein n=1 Tax=Ichthyophthirius multifiliis TaxID=5932 RepID=G0QSJ7_ICHMU|nr:hypothetical protein IMG5_101490 [Ichthyophthirius multifiliis]EGR31835.1 hypothetical protein IMG5_101490 [Ichthyophthirius multifiliis]|eukprot:XP_004035321.1 hypothetical protein IMG5_101490 [Ichthyophthirius multifiliis]
MIFSFSNIYFKTKIYMCSILLIYINLIQSISKYKLKNAEKGDQTLEFFFKKIFFEICISVEKLLKFNKSLFYEKCKFLKKKKTELLEFTQILLKELYIQYITKTKQRKGNYILLKFNNSSIN